ncbi:adenylate/guanylate cyclase domain-containing protein [Sphingomonas jatrophae]|uniref:Adenylate cyclase n=1 Tax=Sphingomonas jatrophae TaxID=1166337 RepID=A0A1I6LQI7_9SPHN|nr:adenylate/guanylate cyclase domain-containing protein [Sphingomonas jatrophae]SFS05649.1 adenylate cyclase [Sphingomonas jatrophae]
MSSADPFVEFETAGHGHAVAIDALGVCRIGRSEHNNVVLSDEMASREHAMIRRDASGCCYLSDSGSRNGTLLNGRQVIRPVPLSNGDVIQIGKQRLRFRTLEVAAPRMAPPVAAATMFMAAQSLITVLVTDIRGFTPLSRELGEARISTLMAEIFRTAGQLLDGAGAWSQKFIGDAIMGVWKHEGTALPADTLNQILGVVIDLESLFDGLPARYGLNRPVRFGAALNTGYASLGNMGSAASADFTALGDAVNKAFRLETASKDLGCDLVVGRSTVDFLMPPLPPQQLPPAADATMKGYDGVERVHMLQFRDVAWFARLVTAERPQGTLLHAIPPGTRPLQNF